MPQTITGWILIAAVVLSGTGGDYLAARVVTTFRDGGAISLRDASGAAAFVALMAVAGLLLWLVESR